MKHYKLIDLKLSALALAMAMSGQNLFAENMDPIEWCSRAGSESARITCLEEALRNKTGQTPNVMGAPPADQASASLPGKKPSSPETQTSTPAEPKKSFTKSLLDKLGRKEAKKRKGESSKQNDRLAAHVSSFKFVGYKKLWVKLDNGQIWQQKKSDRSTLAAKLKRFDEFDIELWQTGFGGYRLHIPEIDRTLSVNRLN